MRSITLNPRLNQITLVWRRKAYVIMVKVVSLHGCSNSEDETDVHDWITVTDIKCLLFYCKFPLVLVC